MAEIKIKNLKICKKAITLLVTSALALNLAATKPGELKVALAEEKNYTMQNDYVETTDSVNMRTDSNLYGEIICKIKPNQELIRFLSYDNWDLVVYKDKIGFVCHDFVEEKDKTAENINITPQKGYISANSGINLRVGPSTEDNIIGSIKTDELAEVIGNVNNNWYLVFYNGKIGFVSAEYVDYKENINFNKNEDGKLYIYSSTNINFREEPTKYSEKIDSIEKNAKLEVISQEDNGWFKVSYNGKIGYVSNNYVSFNSKDEYRKDLIKVIYAIEEIALKDKKSQDAESFYTISKNETCEVLAEEENYYFVRVADRIGYIPKDKAANLYNTFVVVDISSQKLTLYKNNEVLLETDIVSGKKGIYDTPTGIYSIRKKGTDTFLSGEDYYVHIDYWMPFNGGIGLHDASWRSRFGGSIYENNGSHGCINISPEYTDDIYDNVQKGTKVIVQK